MTPPYSLTLFIGLLDIAGALCVLAGMVMLLRIWRCNFPSILKFTWLHADLNQPHFVERLLYRHHRLAGTMLMVAAVYWLWLLTSMRPWRVWLLQFWFYLRQLFSSGVLMWMGAYALALSILVFGIVLALRPSMLKSLESMVNRRISRVDTKRNSATSPQAPKEVLQRSQRTSALGMILAGCLLLMMAALLHPN